ncbi:replication protein P [Celerinatantimonas sp. MCCC 1A17872]|uniref:replication protein P n=1 Tax=Celerinatantimonas sp. MCCC 1A17872 TaxID=3177514 RepID=UPI0038C20A16
MRTVQDSMAQLKMNPMPAQEQAQAPSSADGEFFIEVWRQLKVAFPAWRQAFPNKNAEQSAKRVWLIALIENGVTSDEQIQIGLRMARQMEIPFFPSPGQFIKWCRPTPEMLGLPDMESAYRQAVTLRPAHVVVKAAIRATRFERGTLVESEFRKVFERSYDIICRRYAHGEDIEASISKAIPTKATSKPVSAEKGMDYIAAARWQLGLR